jgi:D-alanyl-D-alanine carboxypeptidase
MHGRWTRSWIDGIRRGGSAAVGLVALATAVSAAVGATGAPDDMPERLRNRLIKRVAQVEVGFPLTRGFAMRVEIPGVGSFSHAEGSSDPFGLEPLEVDDILRMASVTKTFAAVAVLKLVDLGLVGLDEPVVKFVPDCPNGADITVRDLLGMTSGLASYTDQPELLTAALLDPSGFREEAVVAGICALEPDAAPGSERVYNNSGYYLLGPIIEDVTGEPWQAWVHANVTAPLGLSDTVMPVEPTLPERAVAGWFHLEAPPRVGLGPWWDLSTLHPDYAGTAGCGYSTLADLSRWLDALLSGALLAPKTHAAQFTLEPIDDDEYEAYGLGVARFGPWVGHTGVTLGSYAWMLEHEPTGARLIAFVECGSAPPHIDLDGIARDLSNWPRLTAD